MMRWLFWAKVGTCHFPSVCTNLQPPPRLQARPLFQYDRTVRIGANIQAWRLSRKQSLDAIAAKAGVSPVDLASLEADELDPSASVLLAVASALGIPPSWLYGPPRHLQFLTTDADGDELVSPSEKDIDPVFEQILQGAGQERELYVLLTAILQAEDPKLVRAAEASLRSLAKQARRATVPWQSRPPGHFEPPSD